MALTKQSVSINFLKGLDTKTDPFQVSPGKFLSLTNTVFDALGRVTKRPGFDKITTLPNTAQTTLTTLNGNLIATGSDLFAYSADTNQWLNQSVVQPVQLAALPLIRVGTSQSSPDSITASNGLTCLVYVDNGQAYYQVSDSNTGQQIVSRQALPATATSARVSILGAYFIITFMATVSAATHLQYIALLIANPSNAGVPTDISTSVSALTAGYDCFLLPSDSDLYVGWSGAGATVKIAFINTSLTVSAATTIAASTATLMSVTADAATSRVWMTFWDSSSTDGFTTAFDLSLTQVMAKTQIITTTVINEITSVVKNAVLNVFYQNTHDYSYTSPLSGDAIRTDFVSNVNVTLPVSGTGVGTVSSTAVVDRSVGLASKAFLAPSGTIYMLVVYGDTKQISNLDNSNQSTYFLIDNLGTVYMRLAYSNGGGYTQTQVLPNVSLIGSTFHIPYLVTDFLAPVNKNVSLPTGTPTNGIYTQAGVNLAKFSLNDSGQYSSEIAGALHLTGGQLWEYDGVRPVEFGFQVWPENLGVDTSGTGGDLIAQVYYYVFTYEWTDNAGNLHRSAPSIPLLVDLSGSGTSTNSTILHIPTLRLTDKGPPNPVRIVGYRWSTGQQIFYQFTDLINFTNNDATIDSVSIEDSSSDAAILGNTILYTTGGVLENIAPPASIASALFKSRLFLIDAEDRNLLWYSKQVIEATPVETSDLLTLYVAPTSGAQGSTGPMTALGAMDDKLIIFKRDAIYYQTGTGPDNTGANNDFSDPIFITSAVGCSNPSSIVLMPNGLMFQSDKGIWILGRDLSTNYIGADVEEFNSSVVMSAIAIPATNQVRFVLDNSITLMYDYYVGEWTTHTNVKAISATLYGNVLTYLNSFGQVFQESSTSFLDSSTPVLIGLTSSWFNVAGLQGYERFYFLNLLGTYLSPFKLQVSLAYDYNPSILQSTTILPNNFVANWGGEAQWGSGPTWGGPGNVFSARLFPEKQKCQSFQVSIQEIYDPSFGQAAGEGLTLSGLALIIGLKKGYRTQSAAKSFG